jgi:tetratricopeptide (TPR) repeat protein
MRDSGDELEVPVDLRGFGNVLLWMVAIRAPDLVDSVYRAKRVRSLKKFGTVDDRYVPSPALIGWLLTAAEMEILPDSPPDPRDNSADKAHSMKTQVGRAFSGKPDEFKPEWFETLAGQCGFTAADLLLVKRSREQLLDDSGEIIGIDPAALRKAIETTRLLKPATARPSPRTPPGRAALRLVVGEIPREPEGYIERAPLESLADAARTGRPAVLHAVTGLRGVGKTQLAAAYARRRISDGWPLVAWINAEARDTLITGLAEVAEKLELPAPDNAGDSLKAALLLRDHLNTRTADGLLVFDNATAPGDLRPFLPAAGPTQVVVTSTRESFRSLGTLVRVSHFDRAQSLDFLAARTGQPASSAAAELAAELGDLPLALDQAAATISQRPYLGYAGYLDLLRSVPVDELLAAVDGSDYPRAVAAALLLSVATVEREDPESLPGRLLRVTACLAPDGVPRELLAGLADRPGETDAAIAQCTAGSILSWSASGSEIIMHRLLGRVLRERDLSAGRWPQTVDAALDLLAAARFPDQEAWPRRQEGSRLIAQLEAAWDAASGLGARLLGPELLARLLVTRTWSVRHLIRAADLGRSTALGKRIVQDCQAVLGADHLVTLEARAALGEAYLMVGEIGTAISEFEQVLTGRERALGDEAPATLTARNDLAAAYGQLGRIDEAIAMHKVAAAARERVLGPDDPDTLVSWSNLAFFYRLAGRFDEAIELGRRNVADRERVLGVLDRDTMVSRNNLGVTYMEAGRTAEAIAEHERNLRDREAVLTADHPDTLYSLSNLARAYTAVGRHPEAIALHEQTLQARERVLGPDHPDTAKSRGYLAQARAAGPAARLPAAAPEAPDGPLERGRDPPVPGGVSVDVRPHRGSGAHPGPLADPRHVERHRARARQRHRGGEVGRAERVLHVGCPHPEGPVALAEQLVERLVERDALRRHLLPGRPGQVGGEERVVQVHARDHDAPPGRLAQRAQDQWQIMRDGSEPLGHAGLADRGGGRAAVDVVRADVDRDQRDLRPVGRDERQRGGELRTLPVRARRAGPGQHGRAGLTGAAELHQGQRPAELAPVVRVQVVGVAGVGLDALAQRDPGRQRRRGRLHALGEGVAERDVVDGAPVTAGLRRFRGGGRARRRRRGAGRGEAGQQDPQGEQRREHAASR